jgi:hypothetical protein
MSETRNRDRTREEGHAPAYAHLAAPVATTEATRMSVPQGPSGAMRCRNSMSQRAGGLAAMYVALALLTAIPYFLVVVDYPGASTASDKVSLIADHYPSLYAMYLASYVGFGLALGLLSVALWDRLHATAPLIVRAATGVGLLWSGVLVASGLVFTYGLTTIDQLAAEDRTHAVATWRAVELVALALGGAGGELLGGLFVLLISVAVVRGGGLPQTLGWFGAVAGIVGLASVVPAAHDLAIGFGLLLIVWFVWLGVVLLRVGRTTVEPSEDAPSRPMR